MERIWSIPRNLEEFFFHKYVASTIANIYIEIRPIIVERTDTLELEKIRIRNGDLLSLELNQVA